MRQEYHNYTTEDQAVWKILFERQESNLQNRASAEYLRCLSLISEVLNKDQIPDFEKLDAVLLKNTGWSIEVVKGLIPVKEFFILLAQRRFCSSTWLRSRAQLDYLEEPDMFHDIFGHIPLLMDETFAGFAQKFGALGVKYIQHPELIKLMEKVYWYTIEFGLMRQKNQPKIYGAGVISSFGETNHVFDDTISCLPYDLVTILDTEFTTSEIQTRYFEVDSFKTLYDSLVELEELLVKYQKKS